MCLDRRGFLVRQHLVGPLLDRLHAAHRVDHWVSLRQVAPVPLLQVRRERLGNEVVKRLDDPVGLLVGEPERGPDRRDDRRPRDRRQQIADELSLLPPAWRRQSPAARSSFTSFQQLRSSANLSVVPPPPANGVAPRARYRA